MAVLAVPVPLALWLSCVPVRLARPPRASLLVPPCVLLVPVRPVPGPPCLPFQRGTLPLSSGETLPPRSQGVKSHRDQFWAG